MQTIILRKPWGIEPLTDFQTFWDLAKGWRGRCSNGGRIPTERAWERAVKAGAVPREIIAGAKGYESAMFEIDTDCQFWCMPATFINQWRWEQYLSEPSAERYLEQPKLQVVE